MEVNSLKLENNEYDAGYVGLNIVEDKFVSQEKVEEALTYDKEILDLYDSDSGSLDDYDVVNRLGVWEQRCQPRGTRPVPPVDEFDRRSCIEVYEVGEHKTERRFQLELKDGRVEDDSYRVAKINFVVDGVVVKIIFVRWEFDKVVYQVVWENALQQRYVTSKSEAT